ncbi:MAG: ankyrin repeat domain-containing protein [Candidatus Eremiobacteraeota bacterium]|nr:ankyrin repeat domain-containing protein [Candidatus Eremiobacteraeota bacterium]
MRKVIIILIICIISTIRLQAALVDDIHKAIAVGNLKKVKEIIKKNPKMLHRTDFMGRTPLYYAADYGQNKIAKYLLSKGAKVNTRTVYGGEKTPLLAAAEKGNVKMASLLISKGANVNIKMKDGKTPLHLAAKKGKPKMVNFLIKKGASVNPRDKKGITPLGYAIMSGHKKTAELLIKLGACK